MSASSSWMPGGQPSTTQPIAGPWLSPQVVMRNRWPKLLCDMQFFSAPVPYFVITGRHPATNSPVDRPAHAGASTSSQRCARKVVDGAEQARLPSTTPDCRPLRGVPYSFATEMSGASSFFMPTTW